MWLSRDISVKSPKGGALYTLLSQPPKSLLYIEAYRTWGNNYRLHYK